MLLDQGVTAHRWGILRIDTSSLHDDHGKFVTVPSPRAIQQKPRDLAGCTPVIQRFPQACPQTLWKTSRRARHEGLIATWGPGLASVHVIPRSRAIHPCGDVIRQRGSCDFAQDDEARHCAGPGHPHRSAKSQKKGSSPICGPPTREPRVCRWRARPMPRGLASPRIAPGRRRMRCRCSRFEAMPDPSACRGANPANRR